MSDNRLRDLLNHKDIDDAGDPNEQSFSVGRPEPRGKPLDPHTTRLVVLGFNAVVQNPMGWQFRLPFQASAAVNLLAIRPDSADPSDPPVISRAFVGHPELRLGTVDELVALYRQELTGILLKASESEADGVAIFATGEGFADLPSGIVPAMFAGRIVER